MTVSQIEKKPELMDAGTLRQAVEPPVAALLAVQASRRIPDIVLPSNTKTLFTGLLAKDSDHLARLSGPVGQLAVASKALGSMLRRI
jgi:hypothetical protein